MRRLKQNGIELKKQILQQTVETNVHVAAKQRRLFLHWIILTTMVLSLEKKLSDTSIKVVGIILTTGLLVTVFQKVIKFFVQTAIMVNG